jgi:hypothetical protein
MILFLMYSRKKISAPTEYSLSQNYPNPFNPNTIIKYSLLKQSHVTLSVFDVLGRRVKLLVNEIQQAGNYRITFNAQRFASGIIRAERVGFEPTVRLPVHTLSRRARSATPASLRKF